MRSTNIPMMVDNREIYSSLEMRTLRSGVISQIDKGKGWLVNNETRTTFC